MSYSLTVDPVGKTPLYRLAMTALQTGVFEKFHSGNPPAGWFYTFPGIATHFQLPGMSANQHFLDDLCDAGRVTERYTEKFGQLCDAFRNNAMDYQDARSYIIASNLEEEFKIWADAVEELWHGVNFTKTFHDEFLHDIDLCFPMLLNRYFPIDHPDQLQSRLFAARTWVQLSKLDEDDISKLRELWLMGLVGMRPPKEWVQESYLYYWAHAQAQHVEALQELDDILLAIIELSNPEVPHGGTVPASDPNPTYKRKVLGLLNTEVAKLEEDLEHDASVLLRRQAEAVPSTSGPSLLEEDLEHDASVLLGRQAEAVPSTSVPSLPEHLRQLTIPSNVRGTAVHDDDRAPLLTPVGWYNDDIINAFRNRLNGLCESGIGSTNVYYANSFYSTHVYDALSGVNGDDEKQFQINMLNTKYKTMVALLPSMKYLFVPSHSPSEQHWFSILVDFEKSTICSYNSLGKSDTETRYCVALLTHMTALAQKWRKESDPPPRHWKLTIDSSFPIQQNLNDCGPSVCVAMFKMFRGESLSNFNASDMPMWRESIAAYLIGNMSTEESG